jgi:hypothetical protein
MISGSAFHPSAFPQAKGMRPASERATHLAGKEFETHSSLLDGGIVAEQTQTKPALTARSGKEARGLPVFTERFIATDVYFSGAVYLFLERFACFRSGCLLRNNLLLKG